MIGAGGWIGGVINHAARRGLDPCRGIGTLGCVGDRLGDGVCGILRIEGLCIVGELAACGGNGSALGIKVIVALDILNGGARVARVRGKSLGGSQGEQGQQWDELIE